MIIVYGPGTNWEDTATTSIRAQHKRQYANVSDEDDDMLPYDVVSLRSAFDVEFQSRMCFMQG